MCAQWRFQRRSIRVTALGRLYEELPMGRKIMLSGPNTVWRPPTDVFESGDAFVIRAEISGLRKGPGGEIENAEVIVAGDVITLLGNRSDDCPHEKCNYHQMEIQYGRFQVSVAIPVPFDLEAIKPRYRDGFLEVVVPKAARAKRGTCRIRVHS